MSLSVRYNKKTAQIDVTKEGEVIFSAYKAYLDSKGPTSYKDIKTAANAVFNAPSNTMNDIISPERKKSAFFAELGLY